MLLLFFKQKTAYEMRICDWSSDVCSSDLLAYGDHPRQLLDAYRPAGARRAPVVVFVHGGAFIRGAKDISAAMYANVATWFARQGCLGINMEYRLDRKSVVWGKSVSVRLDLGGRGIIQKKKIITS